jgi:hypothetical protein
MFRNSKENYKSSQKGIMVNMRQMSAGEAILAKTFSFLDWIYQQHMDKDSVQSEPVTACS